MTPAGNIILRYILFIRKRLLLFGIVSVVLFFLYFYLSEGIIVRIKQDLLPEQAKLIATGVMEAVMVKLQMSLILTVLTVLPASILAFVWKKLRLRHIIWIASSFVMFLIGFVFTYLLLLPVAVRVLTYLTVEAGVEAYYSLNQFIFFAFLTTVIFSIVFELPVAVVWLSLRGIVNTATLKSRRRYVYVGIVTLAAIITADPTPVSQLILSVPLIFLYEISIAVSDFLLKIKK